MLCPAHARLTRNEWARPASRTLPMVGTAGFPFRHLVEGAFGYLNLILALFNMEPAHYRRFSSFLKKHDCLLPYGEHR